MAEVAPGRAADAARRWAWSASVGRAREPGQPEEARTGPWSLARRPGRGSLASQAGQRTRRGCGPEYRTPPALT
eukprot:16244653-Heterocapsa_arctica.AAC.1